MFFGAGEGCHELEVKQEVVLWAEEPSPRAAALGNAAGLMLSQAGMELDYALL